MSDQQAGFSDDEYANLSNPIPPPPGADEHARYDQMHCRCPNCFCKGKLRTTCVGQIYMPVTKAEQTKDYIAATCSCGWRGIVHDLLPDFVSLNS